MSFFSTLQFNPINWILPSRCPLCGMVVVKDHQFCLSCWQKLNFISPPWCASCGLPFAFERATGAICAKCLASPPDHDGVRAAVVYNDDSSRIAMGLKYSSKLGFAALIANHLEKYLSEFDDEAILLPVPLHRKRLWGRGFNQSVLIASALSVRSGLVQKNNILVRHLATPPLRSMAINERQKLLARAISIRKKASHQVVNRTILLIDDVYTTGATSNTCARILKRAGASKVIVLCWARVVLDAEGV
ncbi:MAG: ComF family protein [Parasphingorhabdus sp.]